MAGSTQQNAWVNAVLQFDVEAAVNRQTAPASGSEAAGDAAIAPAAAGPDEAAWADMHNTLMVITLKISSYAETAEQNEAWAAQTNAALEAHGRRDPATRGMINTLGKAMMEAAGKQKAAKGPLTAWQKGFKQCRAQADKLKATRLAQIEAEGDPAAVTAFEGQWTAAVTEMDAVDTAVEDGFKKAMKATAGQRESAMAKLAADAQTRVWQLAGLRDIESAANASTTVVKDLEDAVKAFHKAATAKA